MPETKDYGDKYEPLRREFASKQEEETATKYIEKYFELQSIPDPAERLRQWNRFSENTDNSVFSNEDGKIRDPDEAGETYDYREELSDEEDPEAREQRLRQAQVNQTYYINRSSTVAYIPATGRFEPAPAFKQAKTTAFAVPRAKDDEFDTWLMQADWDSIISFKTDDRTEEDFKTLTTSLLRLLKRDKNLVLRHLKNILANVDIQPVFGKSSLPGFEVICYVNQVYRLMLIFRDGKLMNYYIKRPKFT